MSRPEPDVSIVLGSYNRKRFLVQAVESIRREAAESGLRHELIVVDGGSQDGSVGWIARQKDIISIVQHNHGDWRGQAVPRRTWGYFMNLGFKAAAGKYICMLSDDCLVVPGAIGNGFRDFERLRAEGANVGALAFYWRNWPVDDIYFVGITLGGTVFVNHGLYLRTAVEDVGFIDEATYRFYCADGDLCLKMRQKGYECRAAESSFIEHFFHSNAAARKANQEKAKADWQAYVEKWAGVFEDCPDAPNRLERSHTDQRQTARIFLRSLGRKETALLLDRYLGHQIGRLKAWIKKHLRKGHGRD